MKARVKATGEIVEVMYSHISQDEGCDIIWYVTSRGAYFSKEELEFIDTGDSLDYWTRLEHQYAGMVIQALLSNDTMMGILSRRNNGTMEEEVAREAFDYAHALVEKYKKEEK